MSTRACTNKHKQGSTQKLAQQKRIFLLFYLCRLDNMAKERSGQVADWFKTRPRKGQEQGANETTSLNVEGRNYLLE